MKVLPVEFLLLFLMIIIIYLAVASNNEPFRMAPPTSSG